MDDGTNSVAVGRRHGIPRRRAHPAPHTQAAGLESFARQSPYLPRYCPDGYWARNFGAFPVLGAARRPDEAPCRIGCGGGSGSTAHPISRPGSFARKRPARASCSRRSGQSSARFRSSRQRRSRTRTAAPCRASRLNHGCLPRYGPAARQSDGDGIGHRHRPVFSSRPHRVANIHGRGVHGIGEVVGRLSFPWRAKQIAMAHGHQRGRRRRSGRVPSEYGCGLTPPTPPGDPAGGQAARVRAFVSVTALIPRHALSAGCRRVAMSALVVGSAHGNDICLVRTHPL